MDHPYKIRALHTHTHTSTAYTFLFQSSKPPFLLPLPHISTILQKFVSFCNTKWVHISSRKTKISGNIAIFWETADLGMTRGQGGWPIFIFIFFNFMFLPSSKAFYFAALLVLPETKIQKDGCGKTYNL